MKVIFIPGNGGGNPQTDTWFPWLARELRARGVEVVAERYPDSFFARSKYWLPRIEALGADEETILVGHSSGAIAAMRYAETHRLLGSVLVSGYHTHLRHPMEIVSGYFNAPWDWDAIRRNQQFIIQLNSSDDPFIPIREARFVHENLKSDYLELHDRKHFKQDELPELLTALLPHLGKSYPLPGEGPELP